MAKIGFLYLYKPSMEDGLYQIWAISGEPIAKKSLRGPLLQIGVESIKILLMVRFIERREEF